EPPTSQDLGGSFVFPTDGYGATQRVWPSYRQRLEVLMSIDVILPDGKSRTLEDGATAMDLAKAISPRLADVIVVAKVDGVVQDVRVPLRAGQKVELLKVDT